MTPEFASELTILALFPLVVWAAFLTVLGLMESEWHKQEADALADDAASLLPFPSPSTDTDRAVMRDLAAGRNAS